MGNVIHLVTAGSEPRVDSRDIAGSLGTDHRSAYRLVTRYAAKFERFGLLRFEIAKPPAGSAGGRPQSYALLNEDQCYFLLSLSRNTRRVVDLKADLVSAFGEARRRGVMQSLSAWQQLQALQIEDAGSHARASVGSRLMLDRKRALPSLRSRRDRLERDVMPRLFGSAA